MNRCVVGAFALLGAASFVPSAPAAGGEETIEVISVTTSVHRVDQPPEGVSDGDTVTSSDRLLNTKGAVIGSDHGRFTHTSTNTYELMLPGAHVA